MLINNFKNYYNHKIFTKNVNNTCTFNSNLIDIIYVELIL